MSKILITNLNIKKDSINKRSIFIDEFLSSHFNPPFSKAKINTFKSLATNKKKDIYFLRNKTLRYVKELSYKLNKIHNLSENYKFWSVIILHFVISLSNHCYRDYRSLKKIKKKYNKKIKLYDNKISFFSFKNFNEFEWNSIHFNNDYNKLIRYIICKNLDIKTKKIKLNLKKTKLNLSKTSYKLKNETSFLKSIIIKIVRFYCAFAKPDLIIDGGFGKLKSIILFFKSKGKILTLTSNLIFDNKFNKNRILKPNPQLRKKINVKEKDNFDKIFNQVIFFCMPLSLVENFNFFYRSETNLFKKIKKIGSAYCLKSNDEFKFLAAKIRSKGGKLFSFQHGGENYKKKLHLLDLAEDLIVDKKFSWNEKKGFATNMLHRLEPFIRDNNEDHLKFKKILLLPYNKYFFSQPWTSTPGNKDHFHTNLNYEFVSNLSQNLKDITTVKLSPVPEEEFHLKIWRKKFNKSVKLIRDSKSIDQFKNTSLTIIDNLYSTVTFEAVYLNIPFIAIDDNINHYKDYLQKNLKALKKKNLIFTDPISAAKFLNKNFKNLNSWWVNLIKSSDYKKFKKDILQENTDNNAELLENNIKKI